MSDEMIDPLVAVADIVEERDRLRDALKDAAASLDVIGDKAGRYEYLDDMSDVRMYADSRARAARTALGQTGGHDASE